MSKYYEKELEIFEWEYNNILLFQYQETLVVHHNIAALLLLFML